MTAPLPARDPYAHPRDGDRLACLTTGNHPEHTWRYGGKDVVCDGHNPAPDDPPDGRPEQPCCADPLCPCGGYVGNRHGNTGGGPMDYPDVRSQR